MTQIKAKHFSLMLGACLSLRGVHPDEETAAVDTSTPGVEASDSDTVAIVGKLAIGSSGLRLAGEQGLLAVTLNGGTPIGDPQEVEVGADGSFSYSASKLNSQVDQINTEIAKDEADWDWDVLAELASARCSGSRSQPPSFKISAPPRFWDMEQFATQLETLGTTTLLISYTSSDDVVEEANSLFLYWSSNLRW